MDIRNKIVEVILDTIESRNSKLIGELEDHTVLLEAGLDSLGYAIVVSLLDEDLGFDPFHIMEEPVYPSTFKEFVDIYETYYHSGEQQP